MDEGIHHGLTHSGIEESAILGQNDQNAPGQFVVD